MRFVICCISLVVTSSILVGCGQTGALQLPNDQNYDKRAKYLLYPDAKAPTQKEQQQQDTVPSTLTAPVSEPAV
jgi:predicted small lipoprotein YifL